MSRITTASVCLLLALAGSSAPAGANEFTDVADAADDEIHDPFDLYIDIGYEWNYRKGIIRREDPTIPGHAWDYYAYREMFEYKQSTHILNLELDVGIYKDLMLVLRVPLVLNDTRELEAHEHLHWHEVTIGDQTETELFATPFKSPERSGVDYFAVGVWWGILNQERDDTKPHWVILAEGRFSVGDELKAACQTYGASSCDDLGMNTDGGISRGVHELQLATRLSRRYGILDPYFGFDAVIGWAMSGTNYFISNNANGQINTMPPVTGTLDFGMEIIPWEVKEHYRKLSIIVGFGAQYHSEGREHTPLFDALGVSPILDRTWVDFDGDGEFDADEDVGDTWSGMTDVENYGSFFGKLMVMIMPAKYIKFRLGMGFTHDTEHFITKTDSCDPSNRRSDGTCAIHNYGHRPEIDSPGNRFRAEETYIWSIYADAVAMF